MKPRNKFEKAVLEQSKHLRPITKTQDKWAFRECIDHFAYRLPKGRTTCMDPTYCGYGERLQSTDFHNRDWAILVEYAGTKSCGCHTEGIGTLC